MIGSVIVWIGIAWMILLYKKGKFQRILSGKEARYVFLILVVSNVTAMVLAGAQKLEQISEKEIARNPYGGGKRTERYEVTLEGELEEEPFTIEVEERQYTYSETMEMFEAMMKKLDKTVLGENESFDEVKKDLNLVSHLEGYPAEIRWEVSPYNILDEKGNILEEYQEEEGRLAELRGTIQYAEETAVYTAYAMVFPEEKTGEEKWLGEILALIQEQEKQTREDEVFVLPSSLDGKQIQWKKETDLTAYCVLGLGIVAAALIPVKKLQEEQEKKKKRQEQMLRDYPEIISKFTLLLSTGMTLKSVWIKIVQTYEENKNQTGKRAAYEEMCISYREMQGGISEKEAYERFGKRCGLIPYMKLSALLSQNLKKGSKGLTDLLAVESMQAFEERKSNARKTGEEAATKLLLPMFAMLAVVLVMVIVPAFLSMQI